MASCSASESQRSSSPVSAATGGVAATGGFVAMDSGGLPAALGGSAPVATGGSAQPLTGGARSTGGSSIMNPVPDAGAQPIAPRVFDEPCDKILPGGGTYAEHAFAGQSATQLATVVVLITPPTTLSIPGYSFLATQPQLKDGAAAVTCAGTARFVQP